MDIRLKRLFLSQLYELSFYSKKCATDCSLIREPLGGPLSLGIRFSESLSMTTDLGLFGAIFDRMSIYKSLKIKLLFQILRKSVESQIFMPVPRHCSSWTNFCLLSRSASDAKRARPLWRAP